MRMREVWERGAAKRKNADCERDALEVDAAGRVLKKVAHRLRLVRNELAPSPVDRFQRRDLGERGPELLGERLLVVDLDLLDDFGHVECCDDKGSGKSKR